MNHHSFRRYSRIGFLAAAVIVSAATGCSSAPSDPPPASSASAGTVVVAGSQVASQGVARYTVTIAGQETKVRLFDASGRAVGEVATYGVDGGRHLAYSHEGTQLEFEYAKNRITSWVNGQSRGTHALDLTAVANGSAAPNDTFDLNDVAGDVRLLTSIAADAALQEEIKGQRQAVPYMFGLPECPWWVWLGGCVAVPAVPGTAICGACFISWL